MSADQAPKSVYTLQYSNAGALTSAFVREKSLRPESSPLTTLAKTMVLYGNSGILDVEGHAWTDYLQRGQPTFYTDLQRRLEGMHEDPKDIKDWFVYAQRNHAAIGLGAALQALERGVIDGEFDMQFLIDTYNTGVVGTRLPRVQTKGEGFTTTAFSVGHDAILTEAKKDPSLSFFWTKNGLRPAIVNKVLAVAGISEEALLWVVNVYLEHASTFAEARRVANLPLIGDRQLIESTFRRAGLSLTRKAPLAELNVTEVIEELDRFYVNRLPEVQEKEKYRRRALGLTEEGLPPQAA